MAGKEKKVKREAPNQPYYWRETSPLSSLSTTSSCSFIMSISDDDVKWEEESQNEEQQDADDQIIQVQIGGKNAEETKNSTGKETSKGKKKKPDGESKISISYTSTEKETALSSHFSDLQIALKRAIDVSRWCNDEALQRKILLAVPRHIREMKTRDEVETLTELVSWFRGRYRKHKNSDMTPEEGRDGSSSRVLLDLLERGTTIFSIHQFTQLFLTILRGFHYDARYVVTLEPRSYKPNAYPDLVADAKARALQNDKDKKEGRATGRLRAHAGLLAVFQGDGKGGGGGFDADELILQQALAASMQDVPVVTPSFLTTSDAVKGRSHFCHICLDLFFSPSRMHSLHHSLTHTLTHSLTHPYTRRPIYTNV